MGLSILKLHKMLEEAKIEHEYNKINLFKNEATYQIKIYDGREFVIGVTQGHYTYGGEQNLLEIMGLLTKEELKSGSILGYLSAKDVFGRIQKWHRERFGVKND